MCTGLEVALISAASTLGGSLISGLTQSKPKPVQPPAVEKAEPPPERQATKQASVDIAATNETRERLRKRSSADTNKSLFTGSQGVPDSELNLGQAYLYS